MLIVDATNRAIKFFQEPRYPAPASGPDNGRVALDTAGLAPFSQLLIPFRNTKNFTSKSETSEGKKVAPVTCGKGLRLCNVLELLSKNRRTGARTLLTKDFESAILALVRRLFENLSEIFFGKLG